MQYISKYQSPLGSILLAGDEIGLTGAWFEEQKYFARGLPKEIEKRELPVFELARGWLDIYFSGREPDIKVPLHLTGTDFQKEVWEILCGIPYGKTRTYGDIAGELAARRGRTKMAAQAVGGAVGRNPISIIVPCHRVVGKNGNLTGYAGGIEKKIVLLKLEKGYQDTFFVPKKSAVT